MAHDFPSHIALINRVDGSIVVVQPGERGYTPFPGVETLDRADELLADAFNARKPTDAERIAAEFGSMFGWDVPGANPAKHEGKPYGVGAA